MKVAIVHDWLNQIGGAEVVLEALVEMFPDAPIFTSIFEPAVMPTAYSRWDIRTTWMNRLPGIHRHHQPYLLFYPLAFDRLKLEGYDLVLSNKSAFCLGIHTSPGTRHVCYCLTPTRFVWDLDGYLGREEVAGLARPLVRPFLTWLQKWEREAARRVDAFAAISEAVRARVKRCYGRNSLVVHPPVDTGRFAPAESHGDYFLIASRLIPYKRIDLAVQAFTKLGLPLWIAGEGRDRPSLQAMSGPTIRFMGRVTDEELGRLYAGCRAFVFPGLEDFGIAPVEAMAAGRPVIAFAGGGALETVVQSVTGTFFDEQTPECLADAVRQFDAAAFEPAVIREHAAKFGASVFKERLGALVRQLGEAV